MAKRNSRFLWMLTGTLMLALTVFMTVLIYGLLPRTPERMSIGDWVIGGLTASELQQQLAEKKTRLLEQKVRLMIKKDGSEISAERTLGDWGLEVNEQEVLDQLQPLSQGSPFQRAAFRWRVREASWTLSPHISADKLLSALKQAFPQVYSRMPVNAQRIVQQDDTISYVPEVRVERIDEGKLLNLLEGTLPTWGSPRWLQSNLLEDTAQGKNQTSISILAVPLNVAEPSVTVQHLQAQGIVRKIGEFTTSYPPTASSSLSSAGRVHNVCSTAASIQDVLLKPGDVFDYAPYIEQTEKQFGFKEAPVIVNGKLVPGIGGGICQVSSTLYNAVLRAGLAIVERKNHSLPVSYVPLGQDATFANGYINFKFRNSTKHYILIRTYADDRSLTVKLFGQTPPEFTYDIESKTVETLPVPVKYVVNQALPKGKQEILIKGKPGYVVETYRYKKQNGAIVSTEKMSRDTYSAQPTVIASNSGSGNTDHPNPPSGREAPKPLIEDGIKGPNLR